MRQLARRQLVPLWVEVALLLPKTGREACAFIVASIRVAVGLILFNRFEVAQAIRLALREGLMETLRIMFSGELNTARSHIEFAEFEKIPLDDLSLWAEQHISSQELSNLNDALQENQAVILLSTSFAAHYYGIMTPTDIDSSVDRIIILQPSLALKPLQEIGFYEKLQAASGRRIDTIPADSPYSLLKAVKLLRKGGIAVARFDSLPTETNSFVLTEMFGLPSAFPSSLLRMAQMANAAILPIFIYRAGGKFVTRFGSHVDVPVGASGSELQLAAMAITSQVEHEIAERPSEYTGWAGYFDKYRLGRELRAELHGLPGGASASSAASGG